MEVFFYIDEQAKKIIPLVHLLGAYVCKMTNAGRKHIVRDTVVVWFQAVSLCIFNHCENRCYN